MVEISFVPVREADFPQLNAWVRVPHVAKWWYPDVLPWDEFVAKYGKWLASDSIWGYFIVIDSKAVGFIQAYDANKNPSDYGECDPVGTYGMDLYIADTHYLGKGYGTMVLKRFMEKMRAEHPVKKFVIDPDVQNSVAIKTYSRVGFEPVREVSFERFGRVLIMQL